MRSVLSQLENDQAILLMYLADELPPVDRAAVDKRLAAEPLLREELEILRLTHEGIEQSLAQLDQAKPIPPASAATQRMLSRMFKQWAADRAMREVAETSRQRGLFARFAPAYPFVAAAALLVGFIVWWGLRDDGGTQIATTQTLTTTDLTVDGSSASTSAQTSSSETIIEADVDHTLDLAQEGIEELKLARSMAIDSEETVGQ